MKIFFYFKSICYCFKKNHYDENNQPVFLIGTNRSGASLLSSILRQHSAFQSLSSENMVVELKKNISHNSGFNEDFIWRYLDNFNNDVFKNKKEGFLWGDPKYISDFYRDDFFYKKALIYDIYKKKINKIPFIKHPFFTLRLKLIKKIFPRAKIIFNIRSYKDFITSNLHKNFNDKRFKGAFSENDPDLGLHWYLINSIAMFQLEKYFKDQYYIFFHEKLYDSNFNNQNIMNEVTDFLNIDRFSFNFDLVNTDYKYNKNITFEYNEIDLAQEIGKFEKETYEKFRNQK